MLHDHFAIRSRVIAELHDHNGLLVARCDTENLVTQVGDQYFAERAAGIGSPPAQVTGMKLGTGSTAASKTGAGAALAAYLTDSHQALAATYPQSSLNGSARRITWRAVWAAGKATSASPITEVVLVNETLADATSLAAATIARALLTNIAAKNSAETLTVTWTHDLLGS